LAFDLIIRNASLPDGRRGIGIACRAGGIAAIEPGITAAAGQVIDAGGLLARIMQEG
jgi:cytosine deaminase